MPSTPSEGVGDHPNGASSKPTPPNVSMGVRSRRRPGFVSYVEAKRLRRTS
jgi:hypothetical protein